MCHVDGHYSNDDITSFYLLIKFWKENIFICKIPKGISLAEIPSHHLIQPFCESVSSAYRSQSVVLIKNTPLKLLLGDPVYVSIAVRGAKFCRPLGIQFLWPSSASCPGAVVTDYLITWPKNSLPAFKSRWSTKIVWNSSIFSLFWKENKEWASIVSTVKLPQRTMRKHLPIPDNLLLNWRAFNERRDTSRLLK